MLRPEMLEYIREENSTEPGRREFSPSRLLGCHRQAVLSEESDYYADIDTLWPMLRGTMVHAAFENTPTWPGVLATVKEVRPRLITKVDTCYGPQLFSGKPDLVVIHRMEEEHAIAELVDYKSTSEIDHNLTEPHWEHMMQINMYRYLVEKELAGYLGWDEQVKVESLEILYVDWSKPRRFNSSATLSTRGRWVKGTYSPRQYEELELDPLPMLDLGVVEGKIRQLIEARIRAETELPPPLTDEHKKVWCLRCPIIETCKTIAKQRQEPHLCG